MRAYSGGDDPAGVVVVVDDVPDGQAARDEEEDGDDHRVDVLLKLLSLPRQIPKLAAYHLPNGGVEEVKDEEHDVDDQDDRVQATGEAKAAFAEAVHLVPARLKL